VSTQTTPMIENTTHPHQGKLQDFLSYKLSTLSNRLSLGTARVYSRRFQLTMRDWRVLNVLEHYAPLSAAEVAEKILNDKGQVSRAVDKLVQRGFVHRRVDPDNRRKSVLELTDAGHDIFAEINPIARQREAELISELSPLEFKEFLALLERLLAKVETLPDP